MYTLNILLNIKCTNTHVNRCINEAGVVCSSADLETMVAMTDPDVHRLEQEVLRLQRQLQEVQERTANHVALLQQHLANKAQHIEVETFHNEQRLLKTEHLSHLFVRDFRPRSSPSRTTRRSRPSSGSTQTRPLLRESAGI